MQILDLLGMYFEAVVVEIKKNLLLFRLTLAILCVYVIQNECQTWYFVTKIVLTYCEKKLF